MISCMEEFSSLCVSYDFLICVSSTPSWHLCPSPPAPSKYYSVPVCWSGWLFSTYSPFLRSSYYNHLSPHFSFYSCIHVFLSSFTHKFICSRDTCQAAFIFLTLSFLCLLLLAFTSNFYISKE